MPKMEPSVIALRVNSGTELSFGETYGLTAVTSGESDFVDMVFPRKKSAVKIFHGGSTNCHPFLG